MHFYWKIIEELKYLGESWDPQDPGLKRNFNSWLQKNIEATCVDFSENNNNGAFLYKGVPFSLN